MDNDSELGVGELVAFEAAWRRMGAKLDGLISDLAQHWQETGHSCAVAGCAGEGLSATLDGLALNDAIPLLHVAVYRIAAMQRVMAGL